MRLIDHMAAKQKDVSGNGVVAVTYVSPAFHASTES